MLNKNKKNRGCYMKFTVPISGEGFFLMPGGRGKHIVDGNCIIYKKASEIHMYVHLLLL